MCSTRTRWRDFARFDRCCPLVSSWPRVPFSQTWAVTAEAKARLTEAVKNYTPPAPEKYRALEEVKECIVKLRNKRASCHTISQ